MHETPPHLRCTPPAFSMASDPARPRLRPAHHRAHAAAPRHINFPHQLLYQPPRCAERRPAAFAASADVPGGGRSLRQQASEAGSPFVGPVESAFIEGKGRGIVAREPIECGQLLLRCQPLAIVTGPPESELRVQQLQEALADSCCGGGGPDGSAAAWVAHLFDGSGASAARPVDLQLGPPPRPPQAPPPPPQALAAVVRHNAFGDARHDLAAAALLGELPAAHMGVWGPFSLLNHSCQPNAINFVLPGKHAAMVVRAATRIEQGEEVTISYLGAPQLVPLDGRQESLQRFGFRCACPRCAAEEDLPAQLARLTEELMAGVAQAFRPRLERCLASSSGEKQQQQLVAIRRQVAAMLTELFAQMRTHLVPPPQRRQLLGSCCGALEVVAEVDAALGDSQAAAASWHKCLEAVAAVSPGSDLHAIVASKLQRLERELHGEGSPQAAAAWAACVGAHTARYGRLEEHEVAELAALACELYA